MVQHISILLQPWFFPHVSFFVLLNASLIISTSLIFSLIITLLLNLPQCVCFVFPNSSTYDFFFPMPSFSSLFSFNLFCFSNISFFICSSPRLAFALTAACIALFSFKGLELAASRLCSLFSRGLRFLCLAGNFGHFVSVI